MNEEMINILEEMHLLSEDIYKENEDKEKKDKIPPISAIVYDPTNFKIIYKEKNAKINKKKKHAEILIFNKIEENKDKEKCKNYNLIITCSPCAKCLDEMKNKKIEFNKIQWLTEAGKEEELGNLTDKKYKWFNNKEKNNSFKAKGIEEKLKLISSFRWIEFKKDLNLKNIKKYKEKENL